MGMILESLLMEGEEVYEINRYSAPAVYMIGPKVDDVARKLDVSGCIEDTLHRMIDKKCSEDDILDTMGAKKLKEQDYEEDSDYYIDLDYVIPAFFPTSVVRTGVVYTRPSFIYTARYGDIVLCKQVRIFADSTDEEVLNVIHDKFGINQDLYIVQDLFGDGSMYGVQSLTDDNDILLLKKCIEPTM